MTRVKRESATYNTVYESLVAKEKCAALARCYEIILSPTWGQKPKETGSKVSNGSNENTNS